MAGCADSVPHNTSYYDKAGVEIIIMSDILQIIHISQRLGTNHINVS